MDKQRWTEPAFVTKAHEWIEAGLGDLGLARTGEIEQPHVTDWATVMRVPTDGGLVWFKAMEEPLSFEGALLELVAPKAPDWVRAPLAHDPATGWMLLADAGERLREVVERERSLERWLGVLEATARIQLACVTDVDELLARGVPDLRLASLPAAYDRMLAGLDDADPRLPGVDAIAAMCSDLEGFGLPETLQHDDLHDGQVFVDGGEHLILDWGDACISHPFFVLAVTLEGVISWGVDDEEGSEDVGPYLAAYLRPWQALYDGDLRAAARLAMRLGWLCRAVNGHLPQDAASTRTRLKMFLDVRP